ncbi:MAG: hypothetical protein KAG28_10630 [Cocleimonas sp.]|nr:hypothetical protein [Cocleimonas sp.]
MATVFGGVSFILVMMLAFSQVHNESINNPLVNLTSNLFNFEKKVQTSEAVITSISIFDFSEENIRFFLNTIVIIFTTVSGTLAVLASRCEINSLSYSVAVVISGFSLTEISDYLAGMFVVVCLMMIMHFRTWKMSRA